MESLSAKELEEFREMFDLVDTNHSGRITRNELRKLMETLRLRPTEEELQQMFHEPAVDTAVAQNNNSTSSNGAASGGVGVVATTASTAGSSGGGITFEEFVAVMARRVRSDYTLEQLRSAFKLFETDDVPPGCVATEVLEHALVSYGTEKLTHEEATRLLAAVDPEGTGKINYLEFVAMLSAGDS
ncbi:calmodulin [Trypanosoma theileri]|uniref:Calmodulin n=1 Tax=Trypanosoma theileri TaxID=67003 RepID=A0A1X0NMZ8_9TRYP|nr:calmodulin [Trypanosoma theileri]ORC86077.1 calmodulin [Trypanosoma theileri]